jgi:hypothetical protein
MTMDESNNGDADWCGLGSDGLFVGNSYQQSQKKRHPTKGGTSEAA